jgi:hypothetical protein
MPYVARTYYEFGLRTSLANKGALLRILQIRPPPNSSPFNHHPSSLDGLIGPQRLSSARSYLFASLVLSTRTGDWQFLENRCWRLLLLDCLQPIEHGQRTLWMSCHVHLWSGRCELTKAQRRGRNHLWGLDTGGIRFCHGGFWHFDIVDSWSDVLWILSYSFLR